MLSIKERLYLLYFQLACMLVAFSAWLTHVITCIKDDRIALLIAGAIAFPIGVIHGWGIWLGFWP
ncbi:hypothetical protein [Bradyrhizobium sp. DASA03007]|uniref:hypothetical protein n=1 Tax=unclassified Bradyrhizobium TaxID=2631580 RepID=UPI003F720A38